MASRLLVVEDDPGIATLLRDNLTIDGFDVRLAATAHDALRECQSFAPDLVLLDIKLPDGDGFELCRVLRHGGRRPVIFVSARSQRADKVRGLHLGADDYVTKPFEIEELVARIHAVLRRTRPTVDRIALGPVVVDFRTLRASHGRTDVPLTRREFDLLRYLAEHAGAPVHRELLLAEIWGVHDGSTTRAVDFAVARLRKKIERDPHTPRHLRTVHGDGYSLTFDVPE
jgi:two-component system OmpR family response regulator